MPAMTFDRTLPSLPASGLSLKLQWPRWLPVALLLVTLALLLRVLPAHEPRMSRLQIDGRFEHVSADRVRQAALAHLGQGFFELDVDAIRDDLLTLPWVARARVERVWPAGVHIRIWEREAAARWNDKALLDSTGVVFRRSAEDLLEPPLAGLPQLGGTAGNEALVARTWSALSQALQPTELALTALSLDARGEWTARTRGDIELRLGPGAATDKLAVLRDALPAALGGRLPEVAYVDLRYTNGFAIGWIIQNKASGIEGMIAPSSTGQAGSTAVLASPGPKTESKD